MLALAHNAQLHVYPFLFPQIGEAGKQGMRRIVNYIADVFAQSGFPDAQSIPDDAKPPGAVPLVPVLAGKPYFHPPMARQASALTSAGPTARKLPSRL